MFLRTCFLLAWVQGLYGYEPLTRKKEPSLIREFRITLPLSVEEFQRAHLYTVGEFSKSETGGGEGVEIVTNEKRIFTVDGEDVTGQYTHKVIHLASKVPTILRNLAPKGSLEVHEKSWNFYPRTVTEYSNPDYMKDNFLLKITTINLPGGSNKENVFNLTESYLNRRTIDRIDILKDPSADDYNESYDPSKYEHGALKENWQDSSPQLMTSYKLYEINFEWWGLQSTMESRILKTSRRILHNFNRQLYCTKHVWGKMSLEEVKEKDQKLDKELNELRRTGVPRGMFVK